MGSGPSVDELGGDAHPIPYPPNTPLHDILHTQSARDFDYVDPLATKREGRIASDDEQRTEAGEFGDNVLGDAVAEICLLGLATQILKGQHGDRWFRARRCLA